MVHAFRPVREPPTVHDHAGAASPFDRALARLLAEGRVDEAVAARARGRWLRQQTDEEATLTAVLADLGDAAAPVVLGLGGRGATPGTLALVGADVAVLDTAVGALVVPHRAITWVRSEPGAAVPVGGRRIDAPVTFVALLAALAAERPSVAVGTGAGAGHDRVVGELRAVGADVVRLVDPEVPAAAVVVPVASITEVLLTKG